MYRCSENGEKGRKLCLLHPLKHVAAVVRTAVLSKQTKALLFIAVHSNGTFARLSHAAALPGRMADQHALKKACTLNIY